MATKQACILASWAVRGYNINPTKL